jgi:TetR/AcrR family transcriptional regulator, mexJK operon transcriptional repressor
MSHPGAGETLASSRREARRQAFLQAAGDLFIEKGYGATSLADVVRRSGGSLATLYEFFGNKAGLFKALIADRVTRITGVFDAAGAAERRPGAALDEFGRKMLDLILDPEVIAVQRLVIAESSQFPELASTFFAAGPAAANTRLRAYLAEQATRGRLRITDADLAAEHFGGLIKGSLHACTMFGIPDAIPDPAERERRVKVGVALFLKLYGPASGEPPS